MKSNRSEAVIWGLDEQDERYRCCFQLLHVRQGALGICLTATFGIFITHINGLFAIAMASYVDNTGYITGGVFQIVWFSLLLLTVFFLFLGMIHEKPSFLIPFLIMQILTIALSLLFLAPLVVTVTRDFDGKKTSPLLYPAIGFVVVCGAAFVLSIWFFWVVLQYYQFLHHKLSLTDCNNTNQRTLMSNAYD